MLTKTQVENIQIDHGLIFVNYGEPDQRQLGPTRGGGEFTVTKNIRDIEYDGRKGKSKGLQVVDEIDAQLKVNHLDASLETLRLNMPYAVYNEQEGKITCKGLSVGILPEGAYLKNVTMFAKVVGGGYKKITLYNALSEADFTLTAAPKGEGEMPLEVFAHWDPKNDEADLYEIEDVDAIASGDTERPTVETEPGNGQQSVTVTSSLTAIFNKDVRQQDINDSNFTLIKAATGDIVSGDLFYSVATKTATFVPGDNLAAGTDYIWMIMGVRDLVGNKMEKVVVNFKTA